MPEISVIVPVYRTEKYLRRCIDSIRSQSFSDYELILVVDGSPDESEKICDEYAAEDFRIHVLHQKNEGVSAARNHGQRYASGKYICYIDSDDWVTPEHLIALWSACTRYDADIALCDAVKVSDEFQEISSDVSSEYVLNAKQAIQIFGEENLMNFRAPMCKLLKREIVKNILFPEDRCFGEDAACVYQWYWNAKKIVKLDAEMYYYFQHAESICHRSINKNVFGQFITELEQIKFFKKEGFSSLYQQFCKENIDGMVWTFERMKSECQDENLKELQKILRYSLIHYSKDIGLSIKTDSYIFEKAFPRTVAIYWLFNVCLRKLKLIRNN